MIRPLVVENVYAIEEIENRVFGHSLGAEFLFFEIKENPFSYYLGIWKGDILLGYIGTHVVDAYASIINFAIDTPYQKQGFGKQILDFLLVELKKRMVKTLSLEVRVSNKKAIRFYENNGFILSHVKPLYYDYEDGLMMMKEVK